MIKNRITDCCHNRHAFAGQQIFCLHAKKSNMETMILPFLLLLLLLQFGQALISLDITRLLSIFMAHFAMVSNP